MVSLFFYYHCVLPVYFKERSVTINAERYVNALQVSGSSQIMSLVQDLHSRMNWEILQRPTYSPDLSPSDLDH